MKHTFSIGLTPSVRCGRCLLPLTTVLLLGGGAQAQTPNQPIDPAAVLPTLTFSFNHTSVVLLNNVSYNFNYFDFNITGFQNVGANNPAYDIFSFSNSTLEKQLGVVAVTSAYLPQGWTFDDSHDFTVSTSLLSSIHADDPQFGLIFIQPQNAAVINPTGALFTVYHQPGAVDPFTLNGNPVSIPSVPEASPAASLGLGLLALGGLFYRTRRRKANI